MRLMLNNDKLMLRRWPSGASVEVEAHPPPLSSAARRWNRLPHRALHCRVLTGASSRRRSSGVALARDPP
jgi:hypothetical protein